MNQRHGIAFMPGNRVLVSGGLGHVTIAAITTALQDHATIVVVDSLPKSMDERLKEQNQQLAKVMELKVMRAPAYEDELEIPAKKGWQPPYFNPRKSCNKRRR